MVNQMLNGLFGKREENNQEERQRLQSKSDRELMIEMIMELKRIRNKCDEIGRKIVIWSN